MQKKRVHVGRFCVIIYNLTDKCRSHINYQKKCVWKRKKRKKNCIASK